MMHKCVTVMAAALAAPVAPALGADIRFAGSAGQFAFDADAAVTGVTLDAGTGQVFGHGHQPFADLGNNIGDLFAGGDGTGNLALAIGERPAGSTSFQPSQVTLTFARPIVNGPGVDLYVFESGTVETLALGVGAGFWYSAPLEYQDPDDNATYSTFGYDLSDLGVAAGGSISSVEVANFGVFATVTGGSGDGLSGLVDFDGTAGVLIAGGTGDRLVGTTANGEMIDGSDKPADANSYYFSFTPSSNGAAANRDTDPDLIYAAAAAIPEPAAVSGLALLGLAALKRRRGTAAPGDGDAQVLLAVVARP